MYPAEVNLVPVQPHALMVIPHHVRTAQEQPDISVRDVQIHAQAVQHPAPAVVDIQQSESVLQNAEMLVIVVKKMNHHVLITVLEVQHQDTAAVDIQQ